MYKHLVVLIIFLIFNPSHGQVFQKIVFYPEVNLQGTNTTLDNNEEPAGSLVQSAKSFCVELGLWQLSVNEENKETLKVYGGGYGSKYCVNMIPTTWTITSVKYLGERDLSKSTITIYDNVNFNGPSTTYNSPEETLTSEVTFSSYFITGINNFAVFSNLTDDAMAICFKTLKDGASTHGAQAQAYLNKPEPIMKSYRIGCEGDGDSPNVTPPSGSGSNTVLLHSSSLLSTISFILGFRVLRFLL